MFLEPSSLRAAMPDRDEDVIHVARRPQHTVMPRGAPIADSVSCGRSKIGGEYLNNFAQGQFCLVKVYVVNIGNRSRWSPRATMDKIFPRPRMGLVDHRNE